ncbi:hypothetical protein ACFWFI_06155 [Streptomyces sp. NPDC060209]|uniref:hypothetical protein n=1 Tax=Streptomyces sp. NPDC060209 TaxID=3347073 RepID=UPI0036578471
MPTYDFPQDLRDAQIALHRTRTTLERCAAGLPWAADPMAGRQAERQLRSDYRSGTADRPGRTPEQCDEVSRLRKQLLDLSITVTNHPYWTTVDRSGAVDVRAAPEHAHKRVATDGAP